MDEPLSNLDAKLRVQMRAELKRFHQDLKATIIYVTHDQLEAVTMADKMAVMNGGVLQQYDSPQTVFEHPVNTFVAGFVGSPAMNLISLRIAPGGAALESSDGWTVALSPPNARKAAGSSARDITLGARHSTVRLSKQPAEGAVAGEVYTVEPTGDITFVHLRLGAAAMVVSVPPDMRFSPNEKIWTSFDQDRLHLFDGVTGRALKSV